MNPLMYGSFLPDSLQVSRDAAERHAILTTRRSPLNQVGRLDMVLVLALAGLSLIGVIGAVVASVRDSQGPIRTVWDYDTRHPLP